MRLELVKQYMRVDYDDDDELITLFMQVVSDELADLIPDYNKEALTPRQQVLYLVSVKELYDNREKRSSKPEALHAAVSSLLLKEMYK